MIQRQVTLQDCFSIGFLLVHVISVVSVVRLVSMDLMLLLPLLIVHHLPEVQRLRRSLLLSSQISVHLISSSYMRA